MTTQRKCMLIVILFFCFTIKGICEQSKYTQTHYKFLDTNIVKLTDIKEAIAYSSSLCEGFITKAEQKFRKDIPVWKIDIITKDRGYLKVELSAFDNSLLRIESEEGPFNYEIKPGGNFIPFSEAQKSAEMHTGMKTLKWNLTKGKNVWEYSFWLFIKSGKAQIRVNAETGEIIVSRKKKK